VLRWSLFDVSQASDEIGSTVPDIYRRLVGTIFGVFNTSGYEVVLCIANNRRDELMRCA
jgi:hypothetical protein